MKRIIIIVLLIVDVLGVNLALPRNMGIAIGQEAKRPEPKAEGAKMVPGPWFVAKVGDTIVYRDSLGQVSTQSVIKVDETTVTVEVVGMTGGKVLPKRTLTHPRMVPADFKRAEELYGGPKAEVKDLGTQTLTISGQKLVCKVKQYTITHQPSQRKAVRKFWTCEQVPSGTVKAETVSAGKTYVNKLVEFKRGK